MKHTRITLVAILLFGTTIAQAQIISEEQALQIAGKFFRSNVQNPALKKMKAIKPHLLETVLTPTSDEPVLYVVGNEGHGYVIVSAEQSTCKNILAYSDSPISGKAENYPEPLKYWLREYAQQVEFLRKQSASPRKNSYSEAQGTVVVAPLLGTIEWDQEEPYNNLCPQKGDERCPAGCLATALAQIMRFHQWPKQGTGKTEYEWYNTFLEADFSQSVYHWDLMHDNYYEEEYSQESKDAIAKLMSDVGIALKMDYGTNGSSAYDEDIPNALVNYFGYDKGLVYEKRISEYSESSKNNGEWWNQMLREELDEGRPIYYAGTMSSGRTKEGHAFVCDGYDSEGYFHFNLGWGGYGNGWFLTSAINPESDTKGYNGSQTAFTHIQPDCGGEPYLRLWMTGSWSYGTHYSIMSIFDTTVESALCIEDNQSKKRFYTTATTMNIKSFENTSVGFVADNKTVAALNLQNGSYTMWPVCRVQGSSQWKRPLPYWGTPTYRRDHFNVTVQNGVVSIDYPDEFKDENFEYQFVSDTEVAITRWLQGSGPREITYPSTVEYKGKTYSIAAINASPSYSITKVTIPASVKTIGRYTFSNKNTLNTILFEEGSCLKEIGMSAFSSCIGLTQIDFPESLEVIDFWAFNGCENLQSLHIPKHMKLIGTSSFAGCTALKSLTFAPDCELEKIDCEAFEYCTSITGDLVFPPHLRVCQGCFSSPHITSADFSQTKLQYLGIREEDGFVTQEFGGCTQMQSIILPPTLKKIGNLTVYSQAFNIPANVEHVGALNAPLANHLTIPATCEIEAFTIGENATVVCEHEKPSCLALIPARNSNKIATLYVPAGSLQAYKDFSRTIGRITYKITANIIEMLPDTEMNMSAKNGEAAILGQSDAEGVLEIPSTIKVDGGYEMPVTSIRSNAFAGNTSITCVDIPSCIGGINQQTRSSGKDEEGIGDYAFAHCTGLKTVVVHWEEPLNISPTVFEGDNLKDLTLIVPTGLVGKYRATEVWKEFGNITDVPTEGVTSPSYHFASGMTIFDLQGRPVQKTTKGIYIVGGRKIVIAH